MAAPNPEGFRGWAGLRAYDWCATGAWKDLPPEVLEVRFIDMSEDMIDPAELQALDDWLADHMEELVVKFPGKHIAVHKGRVVAVGASYKEVFAEAERQGITESPFVMEVPTPEDVVVVPSVFG